MKRKFLLSLTAIVLGYFMFGPFYGLGGNEEVQNEKPSVLKVMSFNTWHFNINGWIKEANVGDRIIDFIKSENPDILLIQEHSRIRHRQLKQYPYRSETPYTSSKTTQAIFSKYPIIGNGSLDLPNTLNNIIYADILFRKDTIRVYNLHLQSFKIIPSTDNFSDGKKSEKTYKRLVETFSKQVEQAEILRNHLRKSPYANIVCGDFNNTQFSNVYKIVKDDLQDTFLEAGKGFGRTYDLWKIPLRIDYILADPNFEVLSHQNFDERLSDHYPVMATLRLKSHQ
ncbi:endonuclease/exonuclease/phosphatase family protein [Muricauda oceani]|uniref:Endonuclease/exonuclease/phosphatase family protein n=1 Tax=Flagellimonas oceani TaxID=2698672 RepID=A0A6G7J3Q2_9FLAO|nr:endonuclease/exonuclease/phosphatase family protein [Allomuricauda oceani]MBW8243195.1 endonuclease/exonuclease/phosphatase family protein [Allomuricauda oceani]QII45174.1 endonuclease/exonuclease/phosphatase family protein [Allomuricauda oceani]